MEKKFIEKGKLEQNLMNVLIKERKEEEIFKKKLSTLIKIDISSNIKSCKFLQKRDIKNHQLSIHHKVIMDKKHLQIKQLRTSAL